MIRFLLILSCFIVISSNVYADSTLCQEHQCIAIVDAGSTGSRLHIYSYDTDDTRSPINITEIWTKKIKPGFATLDPNATTIDAYLTILLADAPVKKVPIYFYATAGMRIVSPVKQNQFYQELRNWFSKQSEWQLVDAKTITGSEEALYGWLSVNYHLGTLKSIQSQSIGIMDMGGASVQIAFPVQNDQKANKNSLVEFELYGQHIHLFVQSFLGLGQTEMSHQYLNSVSCFSTGFPLPDGSSAQGSALSCEQEVSSLLNGVHGVNKLIQPLLVANPVDSWYALGGISNLADSSLFNFEDNQLTNQNLIQQADNQVCQQPWDKINAQFPNDDYAYQYCLLSAYYYALMVDGYGISAEQSVHYFKPDQNLDWTKGVVLHH